MKTIDTKYVPAFEVEVLAKHLGLPLFFAAPNAISITHKGIRYTSIERFSGMTLPEIEFLAEQCVACGLEKPKSLNDVWRQICPSVPKLMGEPKYLFEQWPTYGGWEKSFETNHPGPWYSYDIKSAYAWAAMVTPMPDTRQWINVSSNEEIRDNRLYYVAWEQTPDLPEKLQEDKVALWGREIKVYGKPVKILRAWEFSSWIDLRAKIEFILTKFPSQIYKPIFRQFWGVWESRRPILSRKWVDGKWLSSLRGSRIAAFGGRNQYNLLWARTLTGKIWERCWKDTRGMKLHNVYVDCVFVDREMPTGTSMGDWVFKAKYSRIHSEGAGLLWDVETGLPIRHCGFPDAGPLPPLPDTGGTAPPAST